MSFGWCTEDKVKGLIGKVIIKIEVLGDDDCLRLILDNEEHIDFSAEGDCCSQSWIEHYDEVSEPSTIIEFKEIPISPSFEEKPTTKGHYEEEMKYYFYELVTNKGSYMIEMRNSSNGYYGGSLE